ncbi:DUF6919 domain-containing protein [Arthrobacter globiformis]|uniref:DUF6919 domain-containing protein n=1 Tax=Arthrobacter globiformis TaxID=1665 RepID=UPI0027872964|nr:hypothetical protein [Arthrobacter globiformis]MDQ0863506.1 hypothetical protein [Arthrobacter globiformis]
MSIDMPENTEEGRLQAAQDLWHQTKTFEDACVMTAAWLEGIIPFMPGRFGAIESETGPIASDLAEINRLGLWTQESQPGEASENWAQREFIHGLCEEGTALRLELLSNRSDLVALSFRPGTTGFGLIPATASPGAVASLHLGQSMALCDEDSDFIQILQDYTTRELALVAVGLWEVQIFDPVWGRAGLLIPSVIEALSAP